MATVPTVSRHSAVVSFPAPPEVITQHTLQLLLSLRHRAEQLEKEITEAEQNIKARLEAGGAVDAGLVRAFLKPPSGVMSLGKPSSSASLERLMPGVSLPPPSQTSTRALLLPREASMKKQPFTPGPWSPSRCACGKEHGQ